MRNLVLLAAIVGLAACSRFRQAKEPDPWRPRFGRTIAVYEVLDEDTRERVGFVDRAEYDDGRVLYWVQGPERDEKLGFIMATGRAYRYVWIAGKRSPEPEDLGADVRAVGARKILGHGRPVVLEATSLERLLEEKRKQPAAEPANEGDGGADEE